MEASFQLRAFACARRRVREIRRRSRFEGSPKSRLLPLGRLSAAFQRHGSWIGSAGTPQTVNGRAVELDARLVDVLEGDSQPVVPGAHRHIALNRVARGAVNPNFATSPGFGERLYTGLHVWSSQSVPNNPRDVTAGDTDLRLDRTLFQLNCYGRAVGVSTRSPAKPGGGSSVTRSFGSPASDPRVDRIESDRRRDIRVRPACVLDSAVLAPPERDPKPACTSEIAVGVLTDASGAPPPETRTTLVESATPASRLPTSTGTVRINVSSGTTVPVYVHGLSTQLKLAPGSHPDR